MPSGEQYLVSDLGRRERGEVVEVDVRGSAANVRLMDSSNLAKYKRGGQYRFYGGLARKSPSHVGVPSSGRWYLVVDMQGLRGSTNASVRVLPRAAPPLRDINTDLSDIAQQLAELPADERDFDVFVSHAAEDKDFVAPLVAALAELEVNVWYDGFEIQWGDSLRRKIDRGVSRSRFGVVVLSPAFFAKNWTQYELDGLVAREMHGGNNIILPLWHNVSKDEVISYSPSLADKAALRTSDSTITEIAEQVAELVASPEDYRP